MLAGLVRMRPRLVGLGLELAVPPLSLLAGRLVGLVAGVPGVVAVGGRVLGTGGNAGRLAVLAGGAVFLSLGEIRAEAMLPLTTLLAAPVYIVWKLPIYVKMLAAHGKKRGSGRSGAG